MTSFGHILLPEERPSEESSPEERPPEAKTFFVVKNSIPQHATNQHNKIISEHDIHCLDRQIDGWTA